MMKKMWLISVLAVSAMFAVTANAQGTIINSSHDLTGYNAGAITEDNGRVCVYCHTPHNARQELSTPDQLWNRNDAATAQGSFIMYDSAYSVTMDMTVNAAGPQAESMLCLSCHDGVTAMDDTFDGTLAGTQAMLANNRVVGNDLTDDHPISITYDPSQDVGNFDTLVNADSALGGNAFFGVGDNQVECATCHDVHGNGGAGWEFMRVNTANSDLCTACHTK